MYLPLCGRSETTLCFTAQSSGRALMTPVACAVPVAAWVLSAARADLWVVGCVASPRFCGRAKGAVVDRNR